MAGTTGYLESAQRAGAGDIGQGVDLGKASAGGSRGPSETTEEREWAMEKQSSPQRLSEPPWQSKGLVIWTFPPRYLARGKSSLSGTREPSLGT